jgi:hypothetical protein
MDLTAFGILRGIELTSRHIRSTKMTPCMCCSKGLSFLMHAGPRQPAHSTQPLAAACRAARQPGAADDGPDDGAAEQRAGLHGWVPPPFIPSAVVADDICMPMSLLHPMHSPAACRWHFDCYTDVHDGGSQGGEEEAEGSEGAEESELQV